MLILLPPSVGKSAEAGTGVFQDAHPELVGDTRLVLKHLRSLDDSTAARFYGTRTSEKTADAHKLNLSVLKAGGVCALERYTGVVYKHIDYATLRAKKRATRRIYVVTGMFGLISGGTKIPNYRLPMNAWLAKYWRECNMQRLHSLRGNKSVLSLLPQSYSKAISLSNTVHVEFKIKGSRKLAGHSGKAIKGRFVRFLIDNDINTVADFCGFDEDGFRFNGTDFVQR